MPSSFTHAFAGYVIARETFSLIANKKLILDCCLVAMFPDIDVLMHFAGVPDNSMFGHRGITHSLSFSFIFTIIIAPFVANFSKWPHQLWQLRLIIFLCILSHPLLDALTDGDNGVALYAPFTDTRFSFSWNFLAEAPLIDEFFGYAAVVALTAEFFCFWLPYMIYRLFKVRVYRIKLPVLTVRSAR